MRGALMVSQIKNGITFRLTPWVQVVVWLFKIRHFYHPQHDRNFCLMQAFSRRWNESEVSNDVCLLEGICLWMKTDFWNWFCHPFPLPFQTLPANKPTPMQSSFWVRSSTYAWAALSCAESFEFFFFFFNTSLELIPISRLNRAGTRRRNLSNSTQTRHIKRACERHQDFFNATGRT